jgi:hypothetical protein
MAWPSKEELTLACSCGVTVKMSVPPGKEWLLEEQQARWLADHPTGWEHEDVTLKESANVRYELRRKERDSARKAS